MKGLVVSMDPRRKLTKLIGPLSSSLRAAQASTPDVLRSVWARLTQEGASAPLLSELLQKATTRLGTRDVFLPVWTRLTQEGLSAALLSELLEHGCTDLDDGLRQLLPALEGREIVDDVVSPVGALIFHAPDLPPYQVPTPIVWDADPHSNRDWRLWFQSLSWLDDLASPGKDEDCGKRAYVVTDWVAHALPRHPPLDLTWDEHALAARLSRTTRAIDAYIARAPRLSRQFLVAAVQIVLTHIYAIATTRFYAAGHNHGLMQSQALIIHASRFGALKHHRQLVKVAEDRLCEEAERCVTPEGIHRENSPHYHLMFAKIIAQILKEGYFDFRRTPPQRLLDVRDRMLENFIHLLQPNLTVPQFGDSIASHRRREIRWALNQVDKSYPLPERVAQQLTFVLSGGRDGAPPDATDVVFPIAGYAAFREGWPSERPEQSVCGHFTCGRLVAIHYHPDETSFEIYGFGRKLVAESGRYNNDRKSIHAKYQRSPQAHNLLLVDGKGFGSASEGGRIAAHRIGSAYSWVLGGHKYFEKQGISKYGRTFLYLRPHTFIVFDALSSDGPHSYEQYIHLHPDLKNISFPSPGTVTASTEDGQSGPRLVLRSLEKPVATQVNWGGHRTAAPVESWYFPGDNQAVMAPTIVFHHFRKAKQVRLPLLVHVVPPGRELVYPAFEFEVEGNRCQGSVIIGSERLPVEFPIMETRGTELSG